MSCTRPPVAAGPMDRNRRESKGDCAPAKAGLSARARAKRAIVCTAMIGEERAKLHFPYRSATAPAHSPHCSAEVRSPTLSRQHEWEEGDMSGRANYIVVAAVLSVVRASTIESQQTKLAFSPTATDVSISRDVQYAHRDTAVLRMDVYRRPASAPMPAFIFYNRGVGDARRHPVYDGWARTAASRGFVAILPDLRSTSETEDFQALLDHLTTNAATLGIDRDAIAMYAASGNVFRALPIVEDPKQTRVKAAVMYYGAAPISTFRLDLPVLYVRAGLDRADLNVAITTLISRALTQNAPITLLNHHTGYHGFEIFNDDDATRAIIDQTIDFVKVATSQRYQTALHTGLPEAV